MVCVTGVLINFVHLTRWKSLYFEIDLYFILQKTNYFKGRVWSYPDTLFLTDKRKDKTNKSRLTVATAATAAKISISEIWSKSNFEVSHDPNSSDIENVEKNKLWLPELLRVFIDMLINNLRKQASIGQCVVHATKPKFPLSSNSLWLGSGKGSCFWFKVVQIELWKLGYSCSYDEVTRYK